MKLTLDKTWDECLKMWRWIVRQSCPRDDIGELKRRYIEKKELPDIFCGCFFCEYNVTRRKKASKRLSGGCCFCPARKIDKDFLCDNNNYNYAAKPAAFLRKITELNKIRLKKK